MMQEQISLGNRGKGVSEINFYDIKEPDVVALVGNGRAGTKFLQSHLDGHKNILMIPGYPLMYLYPHFDTWYKELETNKTLDWEKIIDLFCEKHASVIDSRRIRGLLGLERLGENHDQYVKIDEEDFKNYLRELLKNLPLKRKNFLLAVHYAYALCKNWDLKEKKVLFYHIHDPHFLPALTEDFPQLKLVYMVRNPKLSIHSSIQANIVVDYAKLNLTDVLRLSGRRFYFIYRYHFNIFDNLRKYLDKNNARTVRLEDFRNNEVIMKHLADWMQIEFNEIMLKSTFDEKIWWGDEATKKPRSGFDSGVLANEHEKSLSWLDTFVVEGISFHFLDKYEYSRELYKEDTFWNRVKLCLFIFVPTKVERQTALFFLNPREHVKFIRAAFDEARGHVERKDYTQNATYFYKWIYRDKKLWKKRWHTAFMEIVERRFRGQKDLFYVRSLKAFSCVIYVVGQYLSFFMAALAYPFQIARRWKVCYRSLWNRIKKHVFLPDILGNLQDRKI